MRISDAELTITVDRSQLEQAMMGAVSFDNLVKAGKARLDGDRSVYEALVGMLVQFDLGFEMMPGTGAQDLTPERNPLQIEPPADTSGG